MILLFSKRFFRAWSLSWSPVTKGEIFLTGSHHSASWPLTGFLHFCPFPAWMMIRVPVRLSGLPGSLVQPPRIYTTPSLCLLSSAQAWLLWASGDCGRTLAEKAGPSLGAAERTAAMDMAGRCLMQQSQHFCSGPATSLMSLSFSFSFLPTPIHKAFHRFSKELVSPKLWTTVKVCSRVGDHGVIQIPYIKCLEKANPWRQKVDLWLPGVGAGKGEDLPVDLRFSLLVGWNVLKWDCGYLTL